MPCLYCDGPDDLHDCRHELLERLIAAYMQLECVWQATGRCPCGARGESPGTHPHVAGCPTAAALKQIAEAQGHPAQT